MTARSVPVHDDPIVIALCSSKSFIELMDKKNFKNGKPQRGPLDVGIHSTMMSGLEDDAISTRGGHIKIMKTITKGAESAIRNGWTFNEFVHYLDDRGCMIMGQFSTEAKSFHPDSKRKKKRSQAEIIRHLMNIWSHAYNTLSDRKRPERIAEIRQEADERLFMAEELLEKFFTAYETCVTKGIETGLKFHKHDFKVLTYYIEAGKNYGFYHPVLPVRTVSEALFGSDKEFQRVFRSLKNLRSENGGKLLHQMHQGKFLGRASGDASVYQLNTRALARHTARLETLAGIETEEETFTPPTVDVEKPKVKGYIDKETSNIIAGICRTETKKRKAPKLENITKTRPTETTTLDSLDTDMTKAVDNCIPLESDVEFSAYDGACQIVDTDHLIEAETYPSELWSEYKLSNDEHEVLLKLWHPGLDK